MKIFKRIVESLKRKKNRVYLYYLHILDGSYTLYEFFLASLGEIFALIGLDFVRRILVINTDALTIVNKRKEMYLTKDCYIFKDIKIPLLDSNDEKILFLWILEDTFYPYLHLGDNYDVNDVSFIEESLNEGFYFYSDRTRGIDLKLRPEDIVIDAGAWIGDFSAYASVCGAISYAFEPVPDTFENLQKTAYLNKNIIPVNMGLGVQQEELVIFVDEQNTGGSSLSMSQADSKPVKICVTTLDDFVEENKLGRVDFIKADIEGHERFMLQGAKNVLKKFGPRLAICTYHLPDDPQVLENLIKEINPAYEVIQRKKKLFAYVP